MKAHLFAAPVKRVGINPYVDVPRSIVDLVDGGSRAAVLVRVGSSSRRKKPLRDPTRLQAIARLTPDGWFRTTLVPVRNAPTRLYLHTWMREAAGVGVGDRVKITLKPDRASRDLPLPAPFQAALTKNKKARAAWDALRPSHRREMLSYLNFLKTPAALERNVAKAIDQLVARRV